jgi:hypothetical protein
MNQRLSVLRNGLAVLAAVFALGGAAATAEASTPIAVRKCSFYACDSALSLKNEARLSHSYLPIGSIVFVSSQQYPLSAFVRICAGPRGGKDACLITAGDLGAVELDNRVFARAAKVAPIDIPADIAPSATQAIPELAEGVVSRTLAYNFSHGVNPLHNLFNPLTWYWMEFHDLRTGEEHRIYTLDRITLRFPDGSTAQVELVGLAAASGHFFRFDPDSIRLPNGEPVVQLQPPMPAIPSGAGIDLTPPWLSAMFNGGLPYGGVCAFLISHCEFIAGGAVYDCYYRREPFPCA